MKKEYRYCYGRDLIEIPAGGFERGEEGLEVAKRELLEETGYKTSRGSGTVTKRLTNCEQIFEKNRMTSNENS